MIRNISNGNFVSFRPAAAGSNGNMAAPDSPGDAVELSPLRSLAPPPKLVGTGAALAGGQGVPDLVARYFSAEEFQALNSGHYHNAEHPVAVAEAVGGLAQGYGYTPERTHFLQQVALLHDADEREEGTPARAQVTLEWMDQNAEALSQRMGWSPVDLQEAKALIARTDFPFDEKPRAYGTRYDGKSPVQVYTELLAELPAERRQAAMKDGVVLSFADQTGFYAGSFEQGAEAVRGLAQELKLGFPTMIQTTPGFLANTGNSVELDWQIAGQVGVSNPNLPVREELLSAYPAPMRDNFNGNMQRFTEIGTALKAVPAAEQDDYLEMLITR